MTEAANTRDLDSKPDKLDNICFQIFLFDILFLPLFPLVSVSISLPLVFYWYFRRGKRTHFVKEYKYLPAVVSIMALSTIVSIFYWGEVVQETSFATSVKRFLQYLTSFWYFLFFEFYFIKYNPDVKKYFFWLVVYIAFFALIYLILPEQFVHYKSIINPSDPHTRRFLSGDLFGVYRYTFFWADANNVGYSISGIALFYIVEEKKKVLNKYVVTALTFFILACTMSIGGLGVGLTMFGCVFLFTNSFNNGKKNLLPFIVFLIAIVFVVTLYGELISEFIDAGVGSRLDKYSGEENSSGGRLQDAIHGLSLLNPMFLLFGSGLEGFTSEIGHIYVIGLYGLPVYVYFMMLLFGKRKKISLKRYLPLIPFFVGFTMNIAIIDQKFLLILLLICAFHSAESYRLRKINYL